MTRRPADIPPELWAKTLSGQAERLERAWLRFYCVSIPKPYRRALLWTTGWGPIGALLFTFYGALLRPPIRIVERLSH